MRYKILMGLVISLLLSCIIHYYRNRAGSYENNSQGIRSDTATAVTVNRVTRILPKPPVDIVSKSDRPTAQEIADAVWGMDTLSYYRGVEECIDTMWSGGEDTMWSGGEAWVAGSVSK